MKQELIKIYAENVRDFGHLTPAQIMALTLWAETRGEPEAGKIAVASVIIERVNRRKWDGESVREVCLWPKQFSCFNPDDKQRQNMVNFAKDFDAAIIIDSALKECYDIAHGILSGVIQKDFDIMRTHCCQYLNPKTAAKARAKWLAAGMRLIKAAGNHEFFAEKQP